MASKLIKKLAVFFLFTYISLASISNLNQANQPMVAGASHSLPNNQPTQYSSIFAALPPQRADIVTSVKTADARAEILRQYLHRYGSTLEPYADLIVLVSDQYDFDYRWLVAIAQQESNLCKFIPENSNNCWGWGIYGDKITRFDSLDDAIKKIAPQFKEIFLKNHHNKDPFKVMEKYTPPSDGSWAEGVNQFFKDLE